MPSKTVIFLFATASILGACSLLVDTSGLSGGAARASDGGDGAAETETDAVAASTDAPAEAAAVDAYAATVLADHPVAYYRFEERAGTVAADSSGHGLDATYGANVQLGAPGLIGHGAALKLDGNPDGGFANFVTRAADAALEPTTAVTAEAWVLPSTSSENVNLVSYGNDTAEPYEPYVLYVYGGIAQGYVVTPSAGGVSVGGPSGLVPSIPHHLAMTYDGARLVVYVDGVSVAQRAATGAITGYSGSGLGIGSGAEGARPVLDGVIDEVAIYATALSAERIAAHANAGRR